MSLDQLTTIDAIKIAEYNKRYRFNSLQSRR